MQLRAFSKNKMPREFTGRLVDLGVDWLTVTACDQTKVDLLRSYALSLAEVELSAGMFGSPWRMAGYEGFHVGSLEYGERQDGCCLMVHNVLAAAHWKPLLGLAQNCSRLDLQCTIQLDQPVANQLMVHLRTMRSRDKTLKGKPQTSHKVCPLGGMTIESGSRTSSRCLRCYNKEVESGMAMFHRCIRYEVELKKRQALHIARWLDRAPRWDAAIVSYVRRMCWERGCRPGPLSKAIEALASIDAPVLPGRMSDLEKARRWLDHAVRPTVSRLIAYDGPDAVMALLGIR